MLLVSTKKCVNILILNSVRSVEIFSNLTLHWSVQAETQAGSAGDVMECLIDHKNEPEVRSNYKCRSTIEHYQLVSLTDYHFTVKFKEACRLHVARYCPSARTKAKVSRSVVHFFIILLWFIFTVQSRLVRLIT